jgi:hypothetical protein
VEAIAAIYVNAARAGWAHIFDEPSLKAIEPPVVVSEPNSRPPTRASGCSSQNEKGE